MEPIETAAAVTETAEMEKTLKEAGKKAEKQATERRARVVKGAHLLNTLLERANEEGLTQAEKSGFIQVTGPVKGRAVYVGKKGGRADISGFTLDSPVVKQITAAEAKEKHLGKVRGQIDFAKPDAEVLEAYSAALKALKEEAAGGPIA